MVKLEHKNIIVFLGPSLALGEAKRILPDAIFLPPASCGDILRAMRLSPKIIALVDGAFERTAAVWHKEILFALESGIEVFGAGSMGALRGAELEKFGMKGVGKIFENYRDGTLEDDDEVAVLYDATSESYASMTDAMVNIRRTADFALGEGIIDEEVAALITQRAKSMFYPKRTLQNVVSALIKKGKHLKALNSFLTWSNSGGFVDQKRIDTVDLLKMLSKTGNIDGAKAIKTNKTIFFCQLHRDVMCRPFSKFQPSLGLSEMVALSSRFLGTRYKKTRRLAYLLSSASCFKSLAYKIMPLSSGSCNADNYNKLFFSDYTSWAERNDVLEVDNEFSIQGLTYIKDIIAHANKERRNQISVLEENLLNFMRLSGNYLKYKGNSSKIGLTNQRSIIDSYKQEEKLEFKLDLLVAAIWSITDELIMHSNLSFEESTADEYSARVRARNKLHSNQDLLEWMEKNDIGAAEYKKTMRMAFLFDFILLKGNVGLFNEEYTCTQTWWFLEALRLSGMYSEAKRVLFDLPYQKKVLALFRLESKGMEKSYFDSMDFLSGEFGTQEEIRFLERL